MSVSPQSLGANDIWSDITSRAERKRRQNRVNQRARRQRKQGDGTTSDSKGRPFRVVRWKLASSTSSADRSHVPDSQEEKGISSPGSTDSQSSLDLKHDTKFKLYAQYRQASNKIVSIPFWLPLTPDHLIHLVHYNVLRALLFNKSILHETSYLINPFIYGPLPYQPPFRNFCDGLTIIQPFPEEDIPSALDPTDLQMQKAHSSWLNMFPFPKLRDNLIEQEGSYDPGDLCNDLFGEILRANGLPIDLDDNEQNERENIGEDCTGGRKGLIIWGDPWNKNGWEMTPGFIRKWQWALKGCEDLIASSNAWRAMREEEPVVVDLS